MSASPHAPGAHETVGWHEANQRYLVASLGVLACLLDHEAGDGAAAARLALEEAERAMPAPPALTTLAAAFDLSEFERDVVLLCASVELDSTFAARCASHEGNPRCAQPTFSLALAALPGAHWSAIGPGGPLRSFRLIALGAGDTLTRSPLRIEERVLHYLAGVDHPDEQLAGLVDPVEPGAHLVPSHRRLAEQIAAAWRHAATGADPSPIAELYGTGLAAGRTIAVAAGSMLGLSVDVLRSSALRAGADETALDRLLSREAILGGRALLVDCSELDGADAPRREAVMRFVERFPGPLAVTARDRVPRRRRPVIAFEVRRPTAAEQRALWGEAFPRGRSASIDRLVAQFDLDAPAIRAACVAASVARDGNLGAALWEACRAEARAAFDPLAERVEPAATWEDLVLPDPQRDALRAIAIHARQRAKVHGTWGFARKGARGLGISALFAGASGTGKTMAAEVLAGELGLDLYRIDLSRVVSKYIGESEKNLSRLFDAAEEGAAILLFDEADALFGKRTEVKDSHDRYANLEVGYLLQRMESYRGIAILTTNLRGALDPAFLRRLRFVVTFPFPAAAQRVEMWRRAFPAETPTEGLDLERLARMNVTGGSIRNIAMGAAFLAAEAGEAVQMTHVLEAAQGEYAKFERVLGLSKDQLESLPG